MIRYQIYLEPKEVNTIDEMVRMLEISRSQIIRDVTSRVAYEFDKVLTAIAIKRGSKNPLLKMCGAAKKVTRTDISQNINEIYLTD